MSNSPKSKVAVFVGSSRPGSINRKFAKALAKLGAAKLDFQVVEIDDLPFFDPERENNIPASVQRMKEAVAASDAVLFVTPEYNRGVPAVLKNALDWGTRPWGTNVWDGKLATVTGTSPGVIGTAVAQHQMRTMLTAVGALVLGQPEVYLAYKPELIDNDGNVTDEQTAAFLQGYLDKIALFAGRLSARDAQRQTQAA
jgi:chromate reductase